MNERGENGSNITVTNNYSNANNGQCGGATSQSGAFQHQQLQRCSDTVLIPLSRTKRTEQSNDLSCNQSLSYDNEVTFSPDRPKKT